MWVTALNALVPGRTIGPVMATIAQTPPQTLSLGEQLERLRLQHRAMRLSAALRRLQVLSGRARDRGEPVSPSLRIAVQNFGCDLERIEARLQDLRTGSAA